MLPCSPVLLAPPPPPPQGGVGWRAGGGDRRVGCLPSCFHHQASLRQEDSHRLAVLCLLLQDAPFVPPLDVPALYNTRPDSSVGKQWSFVGCPCYGVGSINCAHKAV
jgi:hypothetical protein